MLFVVVVMEKCIMFMLFGLIVFVVVFNIVFVLIMMVSEK